MNVEPLYTDSIANGNARPSASPALGFLRILLAVSWWGGLAFLVLFVGIFFYALLAFVGVEAIQKSFVVATPSVALVGALSFMIVSAVFLVIVKQLRKICQTLVTGDPFVPENAHRLRVIWIAVVVGEILRLASAFLISWMSKNAGGATPHTTDLRLYTWFLVLALIILAEVFREGARLRQEQKLTV
mgnify:CR=1 FL=1